MKLSIVIPCYNAADTIAEQLESIANQKWGEEWEVIVANNKSTDTSMDIVRKYQGRIQNLRIVDAFEKQGTAYAMNMGVRAARSDLLAFCDADDVVAENWIAAMGEALAKDEFVSGPFEIEKLNKSDIQKNRTNPQPTGIQEYVLPPYLPHAGTGNMGVRRSVYESIGGFDETMSSLFDTDFCWRVQLAGTKLCPAPRAILHVRYRDNINSIIKQARQYGEWNVFLYKRYRPHGMPKLSLKHGIAGWKDLVFSFGDLRNQEKREAWLWELGWKTGRLIGCLKYRVLAF